MTRYVLIAAIGFALLDCKLRKVGSTETDGGIDPIGEGCVGEDCITNLYTVSGQQFGEMVADHDNLYWTTKGGGSTAAQLLRGPKKGGAFTQVSGGSSYDKVAIDAEHAYWTSGGEVGGNVLMAPLDGSSAAVTLATTSGNFVLAGGRIYYARMNDYKYVYQPAGGGPETESPWRPERTSGFYDGNWWAHDDVFFYFWRAKRTTVTRLADGVRQPALEASFDVPTPRALDSDFVYYANAFEERVPIVRVPRMATEAVTLAISDGLVTDVELHGDWLYWIDYLTSDKQIRRVRRQGGDVQTLATKEREPQAMHVDDDGNVYWANLNGVIRKLTAK